MRIISKRFCKLFVLILLIVVFTGFIGGCEKNPPNPEITVSAQEKTVSIKDDEVANYNYTQLFKITVDGSEVEVKEAYIDASNISAVSGSYVVTCTYEGKSAFVTLIVTSDPLPEVVVSATINQITLEVEDIEDYNFASYFTITVDGDNIAVLTRYIDISQLQARPGTYPITCNYGDKYAVLVVVISEPAPDQIIVTPVEKQVTIKDTEVAGYDFTKLFTITINNSPITVLNDYIDASDVTSTAGPYMVRCTYGNIVEAIIVQVVATVYQLDLQKDTITINQSLVSTYDYLSLFTASIDGAPTNITEDMITSNITENVGTYEFTVSLGTVTKTLTVIVTVDHEINIINTYSIIEVPINEIDEFDYTQLFELYVDGSIVRITSDMIDISNLTNCEVGNTYEVTITYNEDKSSLSKSTLVKVVPEEEIVSSSRNVVIYPNGEIIDLTTLFTLQKGDKEIPVTLDMITGTVDYTTLGTYPIKLSYLDIELTATVEVKIGVIVDYATTDTVIIVKGTNQSTYQFTNDFRVTINGIRFTDIPDSYIDTTNVDFSTVGTYLAKIKIPYNEGQITIMGPSFQYFEKEITYVVTESNYNINVLEQLVTLPKNTTSYDVYKNITVSINGRNQTLTENKDYVDIISCYVQTLSSPLDFTLIGQQEVAIAVYANGVDNDPIIVTYNVMLESNVKVQAIEKFLFSGQTLFTKELFTIKDGEQDIEVTTDMISGKVDVFTPGIYPITINYNGIIVTTNVVVFDDAMLGTYHTQLQTIPEQSNDDDEDYGVTTPSSKKIGDMTISEDGTIIVDGVTVEVLRGIDSKTMEIKIRNNEFMLYFNDGIIVLDPDNRIKLGFVNGKRPIVYFNEADWTIDEYVAINNSSVHVLETSNTTYSIDTFKITSTTTSVSMWYGLKINLVEKTSADTVYSVTWGEVKYADDFKLEANVTSSLVFDDDVYSFTMSSANVGKTTTTSSQKKYVNMTFTGTINGKDAVLRANQFEGFALTINGTQIFSVSSSEMASNNVTIDYTTNTVFIRDWTNEVYSYKFILDPVALTFTYVEQDGYFGKYEATNMYFYFTGYGTGLANFDTKSYKTTAFTYTEEAGQIRIKYQNTLPSFAYGTYSIITISPLLNVITIRDFADKSFIGKEFINSTIVDGAIVNISSFKIGKGATGKQELLNNIEIITKDGILDSTAKTACIKTDTVSFSRAGYYMFTITINVQGKNVVNYYAVEVIDDIYKNNALAKNYGSGIIDSTYSLSIDIYGQVTIIYNGNVFKGRAKIVDETFTISASNDTMGTINATGVQVAPGIVLVRASNAVSFTDYFAVGGVRVIGTKNLVIREFNVSGSLTYILSTSLSNTGEVIDITLLNGNTNIGSLIQFNDATKKYTAKILSWGNGSSGLQLADDYRGEYTNGNQKLSVDGFGSAVLNDNSGTYVLNNNYITFITTASTKVYKLDKTNNTFEEVNIALDNTLVQGKTFTGTYKYSCGSYSYEADTTFTFEASGRVIIKSVSSSHDEGDYACEDDNYAPIFASKQGVAGTYSVSGNILTINVNNVKFVFVINNVVNVSTFTCQETTLESGEHGRFATGTVFTKQ